jgi:probable rRNA maturation factor
MPVEVIDENAAGPRADVSDVHSPLGASAEAIATAILECAGRADAELSVALVGDDRMRELNRDWRGKDSTTDVLSFSQLEGESPGTSPLVFGEESENASEMLGDVVISVPVLERQASEGGWTVEEELARLLVHGVLHLLGFDHEEAADALAMRLEEGRIVAALAERGIPCAWEGDDT